VNLISPDFRGESREKSAGLPLIFQRFLLNSGGYHLISFPLIYADFNWIPDSFGGIRNKDPGDILLIVLGSGGRNIQQAQNLRVSGRFPLISDYHDVSP